MHNRAVDAEAIIATQDAARGGRASANKRRRVVIDTGTISWVTAVDDARTQIGLSDSTVLIALAPYQEVREELLASPAQTFLVLD
jgi:hypothetical protein